MADASADAHASADADGHSDAVSALRRVALLIIPGLVAAACVAAPPTPAPETRTIVAAEATATQAAVTPSPTLVAPAATLAELELPTAGPNPVSAWRPPPYPVPRAVRPEDHFFFLRPIPSGNVNWPHPRYRYGNTFFGEEPIHTGVDLDATRGTPVLAAGAGKVVWVGYGLYSGTYDPDDPYGLAVLIRHDFGYEGRLMYTAYGHLDESSVWLGQHVEAGDQIGTVGDTGRAEGVHLHFEVRFGEGDYFTTRNPELWMVPPEGWGVLAGRIRDSVGRPLGEHLVQIYSLESGQRWDVWTYAPEVVHPDDFYAENFVISDLPAGPYEVRVDFGGHTYSAQMLVLAGQTNLFEFDGRNGYVVEPTPMPASGAYPPTS
jgi:murein DD-endopeptidase MepM/ murein hydrolase activator NlpD